MARPRKEGMDYFPHDTDAANDEKIEALRSLYGNDGYAFYFILLERVYRANDAELDVSKPILLAPIASKIGITQDRFVEILEAAFEVGLFDKKEYETRKVITSNGIKARFSEVDNMRKRWRKRKDNDGFSGVFQGENSVANDEENTEKTDVSHGFSNEKTGEETRESKVKESKAKESKGKESSRSIEPDHPADDPLTFNQDDPFVFYQNNFGVINPFITQEMTDWCNNLGDDLVTEAMKRSLSQNKRTWSYVNGILKDWHGKGLKTIEQARAEQADYERQKQTQRTVGGRAVIVDKLPASVQWQMEQQATGSIQRSTNSINDFPELVDRLKALRSSK